MIKMFLRKRKRKMSLNHRFIKKKKKKIKIVLKENIIKKKKKELLARNFIIIYITISEYIKLL